MRDHYRLKQMVQPKKGNNNNHGSGVGSLQALAAICYVLLKACIRTSCIRTREPTTRSIESAREREQPECPVSGLFHPSNKLSCLGDRFGFPTPIERAVIVEITDSL